MHAHSHHYRIRAFQADDMEAVLAIWLAASIQAHDFIEPDFWHAQRDAMRERYLPASETYVAETSGQVVGFYSLYENTLAAIFVQPEGKAVAWAVRYWKMPNAAEHGWN